MNTETDNEWNREDLRCCRDVADVMRKKCFEMEMGRNDALSMVEKLKSELTKALNASIGKPNELH